MAVLTLDSVAIVDVTYSLCLGETTTAVDKTQPSVARLDGALSLFHLLHLLSPRVTAGALAVDRGR